MTVYSYQKVSKRYIPEVLNFSLNTMYSLAPVEPTEKMGSFPIHRPEASIRIKDSHKVAVRKLDFGDCNPLDPRHANAAEVKFVKVALLSTTMVVLAAAADTWSGKPAFEALEPALNLAQHLQNQRCRQELPKGLNPEVDRVAKSLARTLKVAQLARRPLELHHHRPLAIKSKIPKFEDSFDPDKHYDTNRDRADAAKLRAEHKKERKGAMREIRKDAQFMAREKLKIKKVKDAAYEKKFKRLVAEIQTEEGREANAYDRERDARKRSRNR